MNWDDLRLLLAVSRRGSLLRAGQALRMSASTLSRRISTLEQQDGQLLVERGADGTRLTARGAQLAAAAEQFEQALTSSRNAAALSGRIRITAGEGFSELVTAVAAAFVRDNPSCSVDFNVTPQMIKLTNGGCDVAIRTQHQGEPSLIYQRMPSIAYGVFACPALATATQWLPHTLPIIGLLPPQDGSPQQKAAQAAGLVNIQLRVSSFSAQLAAVRQGNGAAVLPALLATGLTPLFTSIHLPTLDVFLVTRPAAVRQPHVRAFVSLLKAHLQDIH